MSRVHNRCVRNRFFIGLFFLLVLFQLAPILHIFLELRYSNDKIWHWIEHLIKQNPFDLFGIAISALALQVYNGTFVIYCRDLRMCAIFVFFFFFILLLPSIQSMWLVFTPRARVIKVNRGSVYSFFVIVLCVFNKRIEHSFGIELAGWFANAFAITYWHTFYYFDHVRCSAVNKMCHVAAN